MLESDYIDEDATIFREDNPIEPISLEKSLAEPEDTVVSIPPPRSLLSSRTIPENRCLFDRTRTERPRSGSDLSDDKLDEVPEAEDTMPEPELSGDPDDSPQQPPDEKSIQSPPNAALATSYVEHAATKTNDLKATAAAASAVLDREKEPEPKLVPEESKPPIKIEHETVSAMKRTQRAGVESPPLKLETAVSADPADRPAPLSRQCFADSAILRKHAMFAGEGNTDVLPAVQSISPVKDGSHAASPQTQLPSFRQLTEFAEIATQQRAQAQPVPRSRHHSHSFSSVTSSSPQMQYFTPAHSAHGSPVNAHPIGTMSPTNGVGDAPYYGSPPNRYHPAAYFSGRRASIATEISSQRAPSLTHQSSSSESSGTTGSSADGNSTAHTTPIESGPPLDGVQRPILPPPPGMVVFRCKWPGCTAPPFTTQYLLSSHENVHSQDRPHYCPKPGCSRSVGGMGFKRKNEMIRHGLVHESPGFICPFCSDRENTYSYPRSDNLLRHVRVHHVDKTRDDPELRDVLDQGGKKRRRKTQAVKAMA